MRKVLIELEQSFLQLGYHKLSTNGTTIRFVKAACDKIHVFLPHVMKKKGGLRVGGSVASVSSNSSSHIDIEKETESARLASRYVRLENYPDTILLGSFVNGEEYSVDRFAVRVDEIIKNLG